MYYWVDSCLLSILDSTNFIFFWMQTSLPAMSQAVANNYLLTLYFRSLKDQEPSGLDSQNYLNYFHVISLPLNLIGLRIYKSSHLITEASPFSRQTPPNALIWCPYLHSWLFVWASSTPQILSHPGHNYLHIFTATSDLNFF